MQNKFLLYVLATTTLLSIEVSAEDLSNNLAVIQNQPMLTTLNNIPSSSIYAINEPLKTALLGVVKKEPDALEKAIEAFEQEADIVRLRHLEYWVGLIEEYYAKTGVYPFEALSQYKKRQISVKIATKKHLIALEEKGVRTLSDEQKIQDFIDVLELGLGREIEELYDPQFSAENKPNFYLYSIIDDMYIFSVSTHKGYSFSKKLTPNHHRVAVSNVPINPEFILRPDILFSSVNYQKQMSQPLTRAAFFEYRNNQILHDSKQY